MGNSPIGILDSGVGGLTIWQSVVSLLPHESTVYVGDQAYAPYGAKSTRIIRQRVIKIMEYLAKSGCKLIIIACNTSTVAGIELYRKILPTVPIIGVVPVVKTAAAMTKLHRFAVLSTAYTARSHYQKELIKRFTRNCIVHNIGCPNLISYIEQGIVKSDGIKKELHQYLDAALSTGIDVVALGCTHYPFLRSEIVAIVGPQVAVVDSGAAVARHAQRVLSQNKRLSTSRQPAYSFWTTGDASHVSSVASKLLQKHIYFNHVLV